jgi:hypothetical protein
VADIGVEEGGLIVRHYWMHDGDYQAQAGRVRFAVLTPLPGLLQIAGPPDTAWRYEGDEHVEMELTADLMMAHPAGQYMPYGSMNREEMILIRLTGYAT